MNPVPKHVCNYAVLRFQPYPETEEFVNLGVAIHCPDLGLLEIRVEERRHKRVTDFFPELDKARFFAARKAVEAEFQRVEKLVIQKKDPAMARHVFRELVRPRESIFHFGEIRTILTNAPAALADQLFERYVQRHFAQQKEYQEQVMARRYREVLHAMRPQRRFLGDFLIRGGLYSVKVPIHSQEMVSGRNGVVPERVVKPLDLDKNDPTAIMDHGFAWVTRLTLLKKIELFPERFVFAVKEPGAGTPALRAAVEEVVTGLEKAGGIVVDEEDTDRLVREAADDGPRESWFDAQ